MKIVVVGGNPGCVEYYDDFAKELSDSLGAESACVIPYLGYGTGTRFVGLRGQIDHIRRRVEDIIASSSSSSILLLGHSLGAFVIFEALRTMQKSDTVDVHVVGLMPFIQQTESKEYEILKKRARTAWRFRWIVGSWVHVTGRIMPRKWRYRRYARDFGPSMRDKAARPSFGLVRDMIAMFRDEERIIPRTPYDFTHVHDVVASVSCVYTKNDFWAVAPTTTDLVNIHEMEDELPHAFTMQRASRARMVQYLTRVLSLKIPSTQLTLSPSRPVASTHHHWYR